MQRKPLVRREREVTTYLLNDPDMNRVGGDPLIGGVSDLPPVRSTTTPAREGTRAREPRTDRLTDDLLTDWLTVFTGLEVSEQKRVIDELVLIHESRGRNAAEDRELDIWCSRVLAALQRAMGAAEASGVGLYLVKRTVGTRSCWHPVRDFVAAHCQDYSAIERGSVYALLADLLVQYCQRLARRHDMPLGLKLISQHSGNIAGIFDAAFPGYAQAGMTAFVLGRQTKGLAHAD